MDYYRYIEFDEKNGIIPVQNGKNLTSGINVKSTVSGANGVSPNCLTDGAMLDSSFYFKKSSTSATGTPYILSIDMKRMVLLNEINMATCLVNGSEAAYKYTIEGSADGKQYTMLVDGKTNWTVGFLILNIDNRKFVRYLRLRIYGIINVHTGNAAMWTDGIYEFIAFGRVETGNMPVLSLN